MQHTKNIKCSLQVVSPRASSIHSCAEDASHTSHYDEGICPRCVHTGWILFKGSCITSWEQELKCSHNSASRAAPTKYVFRLKLPSAQTAHLTLHPPSDFLLPSPADSPLLFHPDSLKTALLLRPSCPQLLLSPPCPVISLFGRHVAFSDCFRNIGWSKNIKKNNKKGRL